jgi:hypothetical protein
MMGEDITPKHVEQFAGNKNCRKSHLVGQLLALIHDARTHEYKRKVDFRFMVTLILGQLDKIFVHKGVKF